MCSWNLYRFNSVLCTENIQIKQHKHDQYVNMVLTNYELTNVTRDSNCNLAQFIRTSYTTMSTNKILFDNVN